MARTNWTEISNKFLARDSLQGHQLESRIGTIDELVTDEDFANFRRCEPETLRELSLLLDDRRARHFVKMVVFTFREVPTPLMPALLLAGARTRNPSFNKHFIWPCVLCHGRRQVMRGLLRIFRTGSPGERAGAAHGLYWGAMARGSIYWPHDRRGFCTDEPDEPVDDLLTEFDALVLSEFMAETNTAMRRVLIANLPKRTVENAVQFDQVVHAARNSGDDYIRQRLAYQLGESNLIPPLPDCGSS